MAQPATSPKLRPYPLTIRQHPSTYPPKEETFGISSRLIESACTLTEMGLNGPSEELYNAERIPYLAVVYSVQGQLNAGRSAQKVSGALVLIK